MKIPEAASVYLPRPSTERLKMPPHMIDVQRPQAAMKNTFIGTALPLMVTATLSGRKMAMSSRMMATVDTQVICVFVLTLPEISVEEKRPMSIMNQ